MGYAKLNHGYGYGHERAFSYSAGHGMPHRSEGYCRGMGYGRGLYGHHPMTKIGDYGGYSRPSAGRYGSGPKDELGTLYRRGAGVIPGFGALGWSRPNLSLMAFALSLTQESCP